eukprot:1644602-Rhodomonas_salina.5
MCRGLGINGTQVRRAWNHVRMDTDLGSKLSGSRVSGLIVPARGSRWWVQAATAETCEMKARGQITQSRGPRQGARSREQDHAKE